MKSLEGQRDYCRIAAKSEKCS